MNKKYSFGFAFLILLLTVALLACAAPAATSPTSSAPASSPVPEKAKMPQLIGISTFPAGSVGYVLHAAMGQAITKGTGVSTRIVPGATHKARITSVTRGEALIGATTLSGVYAAASGIWEWYDDGPQKLYAVWNGEPTYNSLAARGNAGIKTFADIKGKRVSDFTALDPATQAYMNAMLAFGGLTMADVKPVPEPAYANGVKDMMDGRLDVTYCSMSAAIAYEAEASVHGIYGFEFPRSDVEGWKRAKATFSAIMPVKMTSGAVGATPQTPKEYTGQPYPLFTLPTTDEEVVYRCVKAIIENYDVYKDANAKAKFWDLDQALNLEALNAFTIPFHPGAVRAFKETGKWTDAHEKLNADRTKLADAVVEEWSKARLDAEKEKIVIGDKKWQTYWENRLIKFIATWLAKS